MFPLYFLYDAWPVLFLRVALGVVLIGHGWPKLRDLKQNAKNFASMGFQPAGFFGTGAAFMEFFGALLIILGLGTGVVSGLFIVEFGIILLWRWKNQMAFIGGWELDLLILAIAIALFALGSGAFSLDRRLFGVL